MIGKPIDNDIGSGEKDQERIQKCAPHRHCFLAQIFSSERGITDYFTATDQGSVLSQLTQHTYCSHPKSIDFDREFTKKFMLK